MATATACGRCGYLLAWSPAGLVAGLRSRLPTWSHGDMMAVGSPFGMR